MLTDLLRVAAHLSATWRPCRQHRRTCRRKDPVAWFHAWRDGPAVPYGVAARRPQSALIVAAALWALSEPVIRLAFATYDPLSVLFTALSAWLIVQACYHRQRVVFLTAAAISLAVANATSYSGIVIDPVVIAFAFFVWLPRSSARRALFQTMWLIVVLVIIFSLLMTASGSWAGLLFTVVARNISDYQSIPAILNEILGYSGLIVVLAIVGGIAAVNIENRAQTALLITSRLRSLCGSCGSTS